MWVQRKRKTLATSVALVGLGAVHTGAFVTTVPSEFSLYQTHRSGVACFAQHDDRQETSSSGLMDRFGTIASGIAAASVLSVSLSFGSPVYAENELSAKYGGGLDTSLVDQTCLVDKCSLQAKACLADDPSCRKGLTCTAKCLGDNACITGCMARYGDKNLDNLLKCTIEDNECIKVAILDGGADKYGEEPRAPGRTVQNFDHKTLEGAWYKVAGYNPNYDCYACQRNTFAIPEKDSNNMFVSNNKLDMDVEFSMPHLLPDGSPPPPSNVRELLQFNEDDGALLGSQSIGLNDYSTHETMVFDNVQSPVDALLRKDKNGQELTYARTAHSEGEMFGLSKFHFFHMNLLSFWLGYTSSNLLILTIFLLLSCNRILGELVHSW